MCILEGFQNQTSLQLADRILKELGRSRAKQAYQVSTFLSSTFSSAVCSTQLWPSGKASGLIAVDLGSILAYPEGLYAGWVIPVIKNIVTPVAALPALGQVGLVSVYCDLYTHKGTEHILNH